MITAVVAIATAATPGLAAHAQPDEAAGQEAAREIAAAQDRANDAATAWALAESSLEHLEGEAAQLEQERAALQTEVDALRRTAEAAAVER